MFANWDRVKVTGHRRLEGETGQVRGYDPITRLYVVALDSGEDVALVERQMEAEA